MCLQNGDPARTEPRQTNGRRWRLCEEDNSLETQKYQEGGRYPLGRGWGGWGVVAGYSCNNPIGVGECDVNEVEPLQHYIMGPLL